MTTAKREESTILTPKQARAIAALQFEREEIVRQANEQIGQIMAAFQEQGRMLALVHQLPRGEDVTYRFDSVDVDGEMRVKLTAMPPTLEPPEPETQTGADEEQTEEG